MDPPPLLAVIDRDEAFHKPVAAAGKQSDRGGSILQCCRLVS
jgi:hypothetical protein